MYVSTWQPSGRAPSDVSPADSFEPKPDGPVDTWVGDQLHKQPVEFYIDPDCRSSVPRTVANGIIGYNSTITPSQSVQENEEEEEGERHPLGDLPMPTTLNQNDEAALIGEGAQSQANNSQLPVQYPVTPVQPTYAEFPGANEPENMPVVPVPLEEYIRLKEIADKAQREAATFGKLTISSYIRFVVHNSHSVSGSRDVLIFQGQSYLYQHTREALQSASQLSTLIGHKLHLNFPPFYPSRSHSSSVYF